jgi:hypothetical protein
VSGQFEGVGEHHEPEEAETELQDEEADLAASFEHALVGLLFGLEVGLCGIALADQKVFVFVVLRLLQVDRVYENQGVCDNSEEGAEVFAVLPDLAVGLVEHFAVHEYAQEPQYVVGDVVGDGAGVGEDGQQFEAEGLVGFQYLGESLDFVEEAKESEYLSG